MSGMPDDEGGVEVVDAGREDQVPASVESGLDSALRGARVGDEEVREGDGGPGLGAVQEVRADRVVLHGGHEDVPEAVPLEVWCTGTAPPRSRGSAAVP